MGYEVMDADGEHDVASTGAPLFDVRVVDLTPDPTTDLTPDDDPALRAAADPPPWLGARSALARLRSTGHGVLLAVGTALVVGALLGGFVSGQRSAAGERGARRSQLAVVAQIESSSVIRAEATVRAVITVRVTNLGPEPVDLITELPKTVPQGSVSSRLRSVAVEQIGRSGRLAAGADTSVLLQVIQACGDATLPDLSVTVRTADGRRHDVPLRSSGSVAAVSAQCADTTVPGLPVEARVEGTTDRPLLVVSNRRAVPVKVSFASVVSSGSPAVDGLVTVLTTPALPLIVGPRERGRVALQVVATRCVQDIATLSQLTAISYPSLIVTGSNGEVLQGDPGQEGLGTSVDISLLVSQALARACR